MLVIKGIDPQLKIQGPTQEFIFNVNLAALQFNNTFIPTSMIPAQNNFETRNNTLSGFRWIHSTISTDTFGSLTLQSFVYGQPTGTDLITFNQDGSITFGGSIIVDLPPLIHVEGTTQTFSYSGAYEADFVLLNTFAATSGNSSFVDLNFTNSTSGGFRFRHTSSTTDTLGVGNFELDYITNTGAITPLFTIGIMGGATPILMNFTATQAIFSGHIGLGGITPATFLQFPNTFSTSLLALHQTGSISNQFFGFGVTSGQLRYQIDATSSSHQWYAGTGSSTSNSLMSLAGTGTLSLFDSGGNPNLSINSSQLNLPGMILLNNTLSGAFFGITFSSQGVNAATIGYNSVNTTLSLLCSGFTPACLIGVIGNTLTFSNSGGNFIGNLGMNVATPHFPLQFNEANNISIVFYERANNNNQVNGLGINNGGMVYQINTTATSHQWYAGVNSTTSNLLMNLTGNGDLIVNGTLYGNGPYMSAYISGSYTQTVGSSAFTFTSNFVRPTVLISNQFFLAVVSPYSNGSYQYISTVVSPVPVSITITVSASFSTTGFHIFMGMYKNNAPLTTAIPMKQYIANTNSYIFTLTTQVSMATNDFLNVTFITDTGTTVMTLTAFNININAI